MGLDMYLTAKFHITDYSFSEEGTKQAEAVRKALNIPELDGVQIRHIEFCPGYWRKSNHIHKWFVDNVQDGKDDCDRYYVSNDDLEQLKEVCQEVLKNKDNLEKVEKLLPTESGFFFGGTGYDEWYFEDVENTIKIIDKVLKLKRAMFDVYYQSSW